MPVRYEIVHFAANDYITSASTIVTFNSTLLKMEVPVTIDAFITWDCDGKISQYDATFKWFDFLIEYFMGQVQEKVGLSTQAEAVAALSSTLTKSICQVHDKYCTGENRQYEDDAECAKFLLEDIRFGEGYELGGNTLLCRSIHQQMVQFRPDVHCAHIGPGGGGMCDDDLTYVEKVLQQPFTEMPFVVEPE